MWWVSRIDRTFARDWAGVASNRRLPTMDCPKLRRRTPVSKWKVGTSLLFAFCAAGCANPGESAPATNLSTQQLNAEIREPIERLTHRSAAEPQVARDGTTQVVDLRGGFQSVTMVRRNSDGT